MRAVRIERLIRIASRMLLSPSRPLSLTETAAGFGVSKTLISDDIEIISEALKGEGVGSVVTDRGRSGGAYFLASPSVAYRKGRLKRLADTLSVPERLLPGDLVYYTDVLFDPGIASFLGFTIASMFEAQKPNVVLTTEVKGIPFAFFTAYALGVPLAVCRFRNRPSDGPAVGVHFPMSNGEVRTMYLGTRLLGQSSKVLVIDDFMRGGSTAAGMLHIAREFGASVVGVGIFISSPEPKKKAVADYRALLTLNVKNGIPKLSVSESAAD